ncbi:MAG: sodium solute transporter superfamily [Chthoniobacteraceae bacterium]|nr:sodium solute transporter superfamily [Chthoniobacteraceae bacterium]
MNNALLIDGLVILAYFVAVISIGLYKGRGDKTMQGFAIGDRNIPWWAVLASILAAEISAATFLGAPGEGYALRNFTYAQLAIGTILARIIIAFLFIKPYYDYRVVSIYEFLLVRFGTGTKNAASAVFLVTRALASGTRLYVAAVVLVLAYEKIGGAPLTQYQEVGIYVGALLFLTAVTAVYTALGGIKAVVWTDVIQATIMFGALGFSIYTLLEHTGGWAGASKFLNAPKDLVWFDSGIVEGAGIWGNIKGILESEYTIWAAIFGSTFLTMATHGTDQDMVQRMLTAKDHTRSRLALILSGLADLPIVLCFLFVGILLWAFYHTPGMQHPFAHYILDEMPVGARGLLVAGIFATAMGSLSTALNALATSFTEDWYVPYVRPGATDRQVVRAARWSTVAFSIVLVVIGSLTAYAVIVLQSRVIPIVLGIFGYTYGSLLGVFMVGMVTRTRGDNRGNLIAMLCGFVFVAIISGLHNDIWALMHPVDAGMQKAVLWKPEWLPAIEFPWRITFGTLLTFGIAVCFRTPREQIEKARAHVANRAA